MTDRLDILARRRLMQKIGTKNTAPEMQVRSLLHKLGARFRLHRKDLPGTPDIVLPGRMLVIFVHGCFWHGHGCKIGQLPKSKLTYWGPKIEANRCRDLRNQSQLLEGGWNVHIVWQCELRDLDALTKKLQNLLAILSPDH